VDDLNTIKGSTGGRKRIKEIDENVRFGRSYYNKDKVATDAKLPKGADRECQYDYADEEENKYTASVAIKRFRDAKVWLTLEEIKILNDGMKAESDMKQSRAAGELDKARSKNMAIKLDKDALVKKIDKKVWFGHSQYNRDKAAADAKLPEGVKRESYYHI